jgi:pentatricopeptide repeat protein
VLLNCVVHLLARAGRMDDAAAFVRHIYPRYGFEPDAATLLTLLRGWIDGGSVHEAQRVFERMAARRDDRSPYLFTQLYRAAAVSRCRDRRRAALRARRACGARAASAPRCRC